MRPPRERGPRQGESFQYTLATLRAGRRLRDGFYRQKPIVVAKRSATLATIPLVDKARLMSSSDTELSLSHHSNSIVASAENLDSI